MAGPENTFIAAVHKHLPPDLYRMKNHNPYNGGIADVWYSGLVTDLWVEYKFEVLPKRDDTVVPIDLSLLQREWLTRRHREGRNIGIIVGCKEGGVWLPGVTGCGPGLPTATFRRALLTRAELATRIQRAVSGLTDEGLLCATAKMDYSPHSKPP